MCYFIQGFPLPRFFSGCLHMTNICLFYRRLIIRRVLGSLGGNVGFGMSVDRTLLNGLCFLYRCLLSFRSIPLLAGCSCYLGFSLSLFVF